MRQCTLTSHELNSETAICSAARVSSPRRSWKKACTENPSPGHSLYFRGRTSDIVLLQRSYFRCHTSMTVLQDGTSPQGRFVTPPLTHRAGSSPKMFTRGARPPLPSPTSTDKADAAAATEAPGPALAWRTAGGCRCCGPPRCALAVAAVATAPPESSAIRDTEEGHVRRGANKLPI